jgi:hypothetical protein
MPIDVSCACGRRLRIAEEYAGRQGRCPACGRTFDLPAAAAEEVLDASTALTAQPVPTPPVAELAEPEEEPQEVRRHNGDPLPRDVKFFVPAPPEIGPVLTASSTLRRGVHPRPAAFRAGLALLVGGSVLIVTALLVAAFGSRDPVPYVIWPSLASLLAVGIVILATGFRHRCSYVGRAGIARFSCAGDTDHLTGEEVFLFQEAAQLRTSQTRHYVNGAYTGTDYAFTWTDVAGKTRYVFRGRYRSAAGTPKAKDPFYFGRSAEMAWSSYLLPGALRQLDRGGAVLFLLNKGNWIRLTPSGLIFHFGGKEEWDVRDLAGVSVDSGVVRVKRHDAHEGWFSSSGVLKFDFPSLGNAQLFFFLVERVLGVPVG